MGKCVAKDALVMSKTSDLNNGIEPFTSGTGRGQSSSSDANEPYAGGGGEGGVETERLAMERVGCAGGLVQQSRMVNRLVCTEFARENMALNSLVRQMYPNESTT